MAFGLFVLIVICGTIVICWYLRNTREQLKQVKQQHGLSYDDHNITSDNQAPENNNDISNPDIIYSGEGNINMNSSNVINNNNSNIYNDPGMSNRVDENQIEGQIQSKVRSIETVANANSGDIAIGKAQNVINDMINSDNDKNEQNNDRKDARDSKNNSDNDNDNDTDSDSDSDDEQHEKEIEEMFDVKQSSTSTKDTKGTKGSTSTKGSTNNTKTPKISKTKKASTTPGKRLTTQGMITQ